MKRLLPMVVAVVVCVLGGEAQASPARWVEGRNYVLVSPVQPTHVAAGKVEVLEVFSYACPACNRFQPVIEELQRNLPANAQMAFLPASFSKAEDMPMFQRAFFAAQALGVAKQAHQAMFDAVWETGELAVFDTAANRLKSPLPTIEDAARCYARLTGVKTDEFLRTAHSFAVDVKMHAADAQIVAMHVPGTPTLIVNGKYRIETDGLSGTQDLIDLVRFLVNKESAPARSPHPRAAPDATHRHGSDARPTA